MIWVGNDWQTKLLLAFCRRTPHFRGKGRIFQWMATYLFGGSLEVHSELNVRLRIDPLDYIGRTISYEGSFEPKSLALATSLMSGGGTFLDVGCNLGLYTVCVGVLSGVRCIAVDGSFVALAKLHANLERNPAVSAVLVSGALGSDYRMQQFQMVAGNLGSTRVVSKTETQTNSSFWAASTTLEDALDAVCKDKITLMKIDVEGSELAVFHGLNFEGPHRPENIIVECFSKEFPQARQVFHFLLSKGYEAMTVDGIPVTESDIFPEENVWFRWPAPVQR